MGELYGACFMSQKKKKLFWKKDGLTYNDAERLKYTIAPGSGGPQRQS